MAWLWNFQKYRDRLTRPDTAQYDLEPSEPSGNG